MAGAGRALEDVPHVVEPAVRMLGVDAGHLREAEVRFVHQDERIRSFVRRAASGKRLGHRETHHLDRWRGLDEHRVA